MVWAVKYFRPYISGRLFTLRTDHKPLLWTDGLKESSARIGRWKERLQAYSFTIVHHKGSKNIVADWLSRALYASPLHGEGPSGSLDAPVPDEDSLDAEETSVVARPTQIPFTVTPVNRHTRQIIWKTRTEGISKSENARYGRHRIVTVWTLPAIPPSELKAILDSLTKRGKTYHIYVGNKTVLEKIRHMWEGEQIGADRNFILCSTMVETVREEGRQRELVQAYHEGKTNHRGVPETLTALQRRYYWHKMKRSVRMVLKECAVCHRAKYDRHPVVIHPELTPTPSSPLLDLQVDVFSWEGFQWLTFLDSFSKLAMVHQLESKSADAI